MLIIACLPRAEAGEKIKKTKMPVAVLDLAAKGVPTTVANAVSDIIRSEFTNFGNFNLIERAQMKEILREQAVQMTGCTDSSCAVQFGRLLAAHRIVVGEINHIGGKFILTARYVNVENGESLASTRKEAPRLGKITETAVDLAKDLAERIVSGKPCNGEKCKRWQL